jgi:hypothetical protein
MIVDLMRNDVSRVCRPGSVSVPELLAVQPHPGVWHLVSTVRGELADGVTTSALLAATFPPGSVTGAPKLAAQAGIAEIEAEPRGAYTGSLGLVSPVAGTEFNVLIRTFELTEDALALGVGGGITADSVPIREWYECLHKAAPLVRAAGSSLVSDLVDEPGPPDPALSQAGVFDSLLAVRGRSSGWPDTWPGWIGRAASSTGSACRRIWPPPCATGCGALRRPTASSCG